MRWIIQAGLLCTIMVSGLGYAANNPQPIPNTINTLKSQTVCRLGNVYEELECYDQDNKRLIRTLNTLYQQLEQMTERPGSDYGVAKVDYLTAFSKSQIGWRSFTEDNCAMLTLPYARLQGGGAGLATKACWNSAYRLRVNEVQAWLHDLQEP